MLFIYVKKAHLIPLCGDHVYVELPMEAGCAQDECGKLVHWLYGCRKAGQAWEDHYAQVLCLAGFTRGAASPVTFWHAERQMWCVVHGDDFTFTGQEEDLNYVTGVLQKEYEIKVRGRLGFGEGDVRKIDVLGRIIELHDWGCTWEADPRHRKAVMEHFGFNDQTKPLTTNGAKDDEGQGVKRNSP